MISEYKDRVRRGTWTNKGMLDGSVVMQCTKCYDTFVITFSVKYPDLDATFKDPRTKKTRPAFRCPHGCQIGSSRAKPSTLADAPIKLQINTIKRNLGEVTDGQEEESKVKGKVKRKKARSGKPKR